MHVVTSVMDSLAVTAKQRSLCTVAATAAAAGAATAILQLTGGTVRVTSGAQKSQPSAGGTGNTLIDQDSKRSKRTTRAQSLESPVAPITPRTQTAKHALTRAETRATEASDAATTAASDMQPGNRPTATSIRKKRRKTCVTAHAAGAAVDAALHAALPAQPAPAASALGGSKRGAQVIVQPSTTYAAGATYDFDDVVAVARKLDAGELQPVDLEKRDDDGNLLHKVPRKTMNTWRQDDHKVRQSKGFERGVQGEPHWKIEFEVRGRTSLSKAGPQTVLGAAETALMLEMANMAQKNMPYEEEEIADMVRDTAIEMKAIDPKTKTAYHKDSNVVQLVLGFKERCLARGVSFVLKGGRGLSKQRYWNATPEVLNHYRDKVIGPALTEFQDAHGAITLDDVGNWDESGIDLCDFATTGNYWCLQAFGCSVLTPYERSPHFTLIMGFIGKKRLVMMLIRVGDEYIAPHPAHAQCLSSEWVVVIAQSPKGWVDTRLKTAFLQLQLDCPDLPVGQKPCFFNVDGHSTNTRNESMRDLCIANKIGLIAPPSHTSAASHGRTQQMDLPALCGGTIACVKGSWRRKMRRQHRSAMLRDERKGVVSVAEIAAMLEQAALETWQAEKAVAMNEEVGYYVDPTTKRVAWDLTRRLTLADGLQAEDARAGVQRFHRREAQLLAQEAQHAALGKARSEMEAAGVAIVGARGEAVAPPTVPVPRTQASLNAGGCYITGAMHGQELAASAQKAKDKETAKEARADAMWTAERRALVAAVEAKLEELGGSVERLAAVKGGVTHLRNLIWSRTAHGPKAKNNTKPDCELTKEAIAACTASAVTKCPPATDEDPELSAQEQADSMEMDALVPEGGGEEDAEMPEGEAPAGEAMEEE
jgi:hypothetical protein